MRRVAVVAVCLGLLVVAVPLGTAAAAGGPVSFGPATHLGVGVQPGSVASVDLDENGTPDLVTVGKVGGSSPGQLSVFLNDGAGSFPTRADSTAPGYFGNVAAGDLNGDGHADVVATRYGGFTTFLGNGDGTLASPVSSPAASDDFLQRVVLTDLNGDGFLDAAAVNYYHGSFIGAATFALGVGDGTFGPSTSVDLGVFTFPTRILAADVNRDGHPDLVVTHIVGNASYGYSVLLNDGSGALTALPAVLFTYTTSLGTTNFRAEFHELAVADLDGNGIPDLVATESNSNAEALWFFEGNDDGTFDMANGQSRRAADGAVAVSLADFDHDGIIDVAVGLASSPEAVSVFAGQPGTWPTTNPVSSTSTTSTSGGDYDLITPDLNNDGSFDFVSTDIPGQSLVTRLGPVGDAAPPAVTLLAPLDGASYTIGQNVPASFSCDDGSGSGVATCTGSVPDGTPIDTSIAGAHAFSVTTTDNAGNTQLVSASYQVLQGNVTTTAAPGGTVTTDPGGLGATPDAPVQTEIVVPSDGGGTISVAPVAGTPPTGYALFGQVLQLDGPPASGPSSPYVVTFRVDASALGGVAPADIQILRNGVLVGPCTDPTAAVPDPCIAAADYVTGGGGDAYVTVRTTHFSLWSIARLAYTPTGFFAPIDNLPTVNTVKAGSAVPIKFGLGGNRGLNVFAKRSPASASVACGAGPSDPIEQTVTAGASTLSYDAGSARYQYVWKTDKAWTGCRDLVLRFRDGSVLRARFSFK